MTGTQASRRSRGSAMMVGERRHSIEAVRRRTVERWRVRMPERVTIRRVGSPSAESTRFPGEGQSAQGQSGPKARPKGVADGHGVNIPRPEVRLSRGGRRGFTSRGVRRPRAARPTAFDLEACDPPGHEKPREDEPSARTAIRHRCARRASEGVRENSREGTRQNDPVPSV